MCCIVGALIVCAIDTEAFCVVICLTKHLELIRAQTGVMRNKNDGTHGLKCLLDEQKPGLNRSSIHIERIRTAVGQGTEDKSNNIN